MESKQELVKKILLTPIDVIQKEDGICLKNGIIYSGQKYNSNLDPDMSDFTIGFYEILYKNFLNYCHILNQNGDFADDNFAGDTMYGFNPIANRTPGAGKNADIRKTIPTDSLPKYLQNYYKQYHCLANFWIIPKEHGRCSAKLVYIDIPELYIDKLFNDLNTMQKKYTSYFEKISNKKEFLEIHCCENNYICTDIQNLFDISYPNKSYVISNQMINYFECKINNRAVSIAYSKYCDELYDYFERVGVL